MSLKTKYFAELQGYIDTQSDALLDGKCPDMVTYARSCGIIYGLKMAMQEFDDVLSNSVETKEEFEDHP